MMGNISQIAIALLVFAGGVYLLFFTNRIQKQLVDNRKNLGAKVAAKISGSIFIHIFYRIFGAALIVLAAAILMDRVFPGFKPFEKL